MKKIILITTLLFASNALADYKILIQNAKLDLPASSSGSAPNESDPWEPPSGEPAQHPNGVTVTCLNMPNGEEFELNGKTYQVVYTKEEAINNAEIACTSNVTDMSNMFSGADNFNASISHWDTSKVTDMGFMFYGANSFNQDIGNWNVSNVTIMGHMFRSAHSFNQDISGWDTENVTDMSYMFRFANSFNQNLNSWCVDYFSEMPYRFSSGTMLSIDDEPLWGEACN